MALLFMDSFDHYATADIGEKWTEIQFLFASFASVTINAGTGRHSSASYRLSTGNSTQQQIALRKNCTAADATSILGFAFTFQASDIIGTSGWQIASIRDGSTSQVSLRLNSDLRLSVVRGTVAGTVLGTTSGSISAGSYTYIEWKVKVDASVGTVDLRVNGASVLSLTSQNTRNTANTSWNSFALGNYDSVGSSSTTVNGRSIDYDDVYILDGSGAAPWNTFLGDVRVDARKPTGAGTTTGWTPLSSTNWSNVDDAAPDDDTTYNSTSTLNAIDTFVVEDAPVAGATIYGIQHCLSMKKSDAGTCTVAPVIRHSGTNNSGTSISPGTSYAYGLQIATEIAPGVAITESNFNAAEFGYVRIT